ncbi:MAG: PepSY domain-containing protein [Burkholderiaceae bacterium]|nr:PepSY domain-containing protein [Burkholderiaceae bacterium]
MRTSKLLAACALGTSLIAGGALYAPAFAQTAATQTTAPKAEATQAAPAQPGATHSRHMKRQSYAEKMKNVDTSQWLSIKAVYDKVETAGYKDVNSIMRTPKGYVVSATNADGKWTRLSVDPVKGDVTQMQHKGKHNGKHHDTQKS